MGRFRKTISSIGLCPLARECRNNVCLLRADKIHGYPLTPSTKDEQNKAKEIESKIGKTYLPQFITQLRDGKVDVVCPDFTD
jgi:hypothetical protein